MTDTGRVRQGTRAWFEMVGTSMTEAALRAGLSSNDDVSLVERYTDGVDFGAGLVQGFRFDLVAGKPSFRVGVRPDERGDITVTVTAAVARELNLLPAEASMTARRRYRQTGEIREEGDLSRLGEWFAPVRESIFARTM